MNKDRILELVRKLGEDPELDGLIRELIQRSSQLEKDSHPRRFSYNKLLHLLWEADRSKPLGGE